MYNTSALVLDRKYYDRLFRERRFSDLRRALRAARLRWVWPGGGRQRQATIDYINQLLRLQPPPNPRRPNHWYWEVR